MIKFKFHIKADSSFSSTNPVDDNGGNMQASGKNTLKIILIVFGVFGLVCITAFIGFFSVVFNGINSMQKGAEEKSEQRKTIHALPVLKCKIYTDETVTAPISGSEAAFYFLRIGTEHYLKYDRLRANTETQGDIQIYENFDYSMITKYPKGTKLSVNGNLYAFDFKYSIMDTLGNNNNHFSGKIVSRKEKNTSMYAPFRSKDHQIIDHFKNEHPWISSYLENINGYKNIVMEEYTFKNGDSIYIKGKIKDDKIVAFNEHQLYTPYRTQKQIREDRGIK